MVRQLGTEDVARFLGPVPISLGDAGALDPDFANVAVGTGLHRFRVGDDDLLPRTTLARANQTTSFAASVDGMSRLQFIGKEIANHRSDVFVTTRDDQRRFGQPVARIKRFAAETTRLERFAKAVNRFGANRLGPLKARVHFDKSNSARCSGVVFRTQRS